MSPELIDHLKKAEGEMIEALWSLACSGEVVLYEQILAAKLEISAILDRLLAR